MIKKKLEYQEEMGSSKAEVCIRQISKKNLNNSVDLKEGEISKNYSIEDNSKNTNKQVRGRQLYPNNIYTYSKKNNSSLATTCESKKRMGRKSNYFNLLSCANFLLFIFFFFILEPKVHRIIIFI